MNWQKEIDGIKTQIEFLERRLANLEFNLNKEKDDEREISSDR